MKNAFSRAMRLALVGAALSPLMCATAHAADGSWSGADNALWTNSANWSASPYPGSASGETAAFDSAGNGYTTLNLAGLFSLANLAFTSSGVAGYTIGSGGVNVQALLLEAGGLIDLDGTVGSGQTIEASVLLGADTATGSYVFNNDSASHSLTVAGDVSGATGGGTPGVKTLTVAGAGCTLLSGVIADGGASRLDLVSSSTRTNTLAGLNTFSGNVSINAGGALSVAKIGNQTSTDSNLGAGTTVFFGASNARLLYTGSGETSDRILSPNTATSTSIIDHQGTGTLTLTGGISPTLAGNKQIRLQGGNVVTGIVAGVISDFNSASTNNLYKAGANTWTLAGDNTFKGSVYVQDGVLRVTRSGGFGAGPKTATAANNANNANPSIHLDGSAGDLTIPADITFQTSSQRAGAVVNIAGNNTIQGNFSLTTGDGATHLWSKGGKLTITGNLTPTATSRQLHLRGDADGEISGVIANGTTANLPVLKDVGTGTWTLSGANTFSGATTVSAGTLALAGADGTINASSSISVGAGAALVLTNTAAANSSDRLKDDAPVTLNGATFAFANDASEADFSETAGSLTLAAGGCTLATSQAAEGRSSTLTFAGLTRATASALNFTGAGLGNSARNRIFITGQADGPIGAWATVNGTHAALYSSTLGVYSEVSTEIAAKGDTIVHNSSNVVITTEGSTGPNELSDDVTSVGSLSQNSAYASTVNTAGKTLRADSVMIAAGKADLTLGVAANDGALTPATAGGELALVNNSDSTLAVNAVIADSGTPSSLIKSGPGAVVLAGTNTFSGTASVAQGTLTLSDSLALQNAVLASGGLAFDSAVASHAFTLGNLTNIVNQALEDTAANPVTLTVGNNSAESSFGGGLSGSGSLVKAGSGTLTVTGANAHSGGTSVGAGGALTASQNGALGIGPVANDGVLNLTVGNTTYSGLSASLSGTGTVNVTLGSGSNINPLNGDYSGFTGVWNLGASGTGGKAQMNGADNAAATVNVLSNASLYVSATGTHSATAYLYGGDTGESYGQLRLEGFSDWAGPVKLADDVSGAGDGFFGANSGTGTVSGVISDIGGAHPVSKVGGGNIILANSANTYVGQTWVRAGTLGVTSLKNAGVASSLGQASGADSAIKVSNGGTHARLAYYGTGDTTDRAIDMAGTTGGLYLEQAGSGLLTFTSDLTYSGAGGKTLNLQGSTEGVGELAGVFADGLPYTNKLIKTGTGKWILSKANAYSGETEIQNGTLALANPNAIPAASLVRFTTTRNGVLSFDNDGAGETELNITIGVGVDGTLLSGANAGGVGISHTVNDLSLSQVTLTVGRASSVLSGTPSIHVRTLNLSGGGTYTTTLNPLDADLQLGAAAILANSQAKTLRLDGTSTGSSVTGTLYNGLNTLAVYKAGAGTWTLSGSNTYSGATTVNGGLLTVSGELGAIAGTSGFTVNTGAILRVSNTAAQNSPNRLRDAAGITLSGGTLDFAHAAGAADYSEAVGAVNLAGTGASVAASQADSDRTSALTLASLTRSANATIDFSGTGLGDDARNRIFIAAQPDGLIGFWASCNGVFPALYSSTRGVYDGEFTENAIAARGPSSTIPDDAAVSAVITTPGTQGPITLAGATENSIGLLRQNVGTPALVAMTNKTLHALAVAIHPGQAALTLGTAAEEGTLTALTAGGKLELVNDSAEALTVNAALANNTSDSSLAKNGTGDVLLMGACAYSGDTLIGAGTLRYGSELPQSLAGVISGAGTLAKSGTNLLHLLAANTFTGPTTIDQGTVRADQNSTFGTSAGGVFIADGATLDVGCSIDVGGTRGTNSIDLGSELFTVTGAGVNGLGAIVNNSLVSQYKAFGKITLAGDTTFGGTQRWDLRQNTPALTLNNHTLTKVGPNLIGFTGANVYPGAGHIDVAQGILRLETGAKLNGGATNTLTVRTGAEFELYNVSNPQYWHLLLENSTTFDAANNSDASTRNRWAGPITLNGAVTLTGGSGYVANLLGGIDGSGPLTKTGSANITVSGTTNTYTGATLVNGGTLSVSNLCSVGVACSLGQPGNATDGTIQIGTGSTSATLTYLGTGDTTDRILDLAGTTGGATVNQSGNGLLLLTGDVTASGLGAKTLTLGGSTAGTAEIAGGIQNPASGKTGLSKTGTGTWTLSGANTFTGEVSVSAGKLVLSGDIAQGPGAINIGSATMRITDGATLTGSGGIRCGTSSGHQAALYMTGGIVRRTPKTGDDNAFTLGRNAGSCSSFHMSGGDLTITRIQTCSSSSGGTTNIGVLRMTGGTITFPDYILIARGKGGQSAFTVDGGTINHTNAGNNLSIGYEGGRGELNLTGGTLENFGKNLTVKQNTGYSGGATGIINLCAGLLSVDLMQNTAPGVALLNFAGGTLKAGNVNSAVFVPTSMTGVYSYGPFGAFAGGATIDSAGRDITLAAPLRAPAGQGVTAITLADKGSGYIGEPYVLIDGPDGLGATAVANMEDDETGNGTYRVASVTITCPGVDYVTAPSVVFRGGGTAAVAPTVADVTLSPNVSGGLTKQGAGTLTLGAANTYTGTTAVAAGTLKLGHAAALPAQTQVALAGGTLDLNGHTVTNAVNGSGTLANGTAQAVISPSGEGALGTDTLTLSDVSLRGTYVVDVTAAGESDLLAVQGDIDLSNFTLQIVRPDQLDRHKIYTLLTCSGTRTGTFSSSNLPDTRWHVVYFSNGTVKLIFVDGTLIRIR